VLGILSGARVQVRRTDYTKRLLVCLPPHRELPQHQRRWQHWDIFNNATTQGGAARFRRRRIGSQCQFVRERRCFTPRAMSNEVCRAAELMDCGRRPNKTKAGGRCGASVSSCPDQGHAPHERSICDSGARLPATALPLFFDRAHHDAGLAWVRTDDHFGPLGTSAEDLFVTVRPGIVKHVNGVIRY
jgi:hypothetical protein